jgi:hypothetical protein
MGYVLDSHPTWTIDEGRIFLATEIKKHLGTDHERLKHLDMAHYVPPTTAAAIAVTYGEDIGPLVQVVGFLAHAGNEHTGKAFRFTIPHRLKWSDFERFAKDQALVFRNACRKMRLEERGANLKLVVNT